VETNISTHGGTHKDGRTKGKTIQSRVKKKFTRWKNENDCCREAKQASEKKWLENARGH